MSNSESIIYFVAILGCAISFLATSIWSFVSKNPVNFWAGEKIPSDFVTDIKKYNHAYGILWLVYGLFWLIAAVLGLFSLSISVALVIIDCVGIIILILINFQIRKRYFKSADCDSHV